MSTIIGIDPGKSGGMVCLVDGEPAIRHKLSDLTPHDLCESLNAMTSMDDDATVFIEKVNAGPKMGSSAAFKFGQSYAEVRMAAIAGGLRLVMVTPQKWQREFGLIVSGRGLGQSDTEKKNRNKAKAQELFPGIKITHAIADALLIAEYGRRQQLVEA